MPHGLCTIGDVPHAAGGWGKGVFICKVWSSGHEDGPQPTIDGKEPGE